MRVCVALSNLLIAGGCTNAAFDSAQVRHQTSPIPTPGVQIPAQNQNSQDAALPQQSEDSNVPIVQSSLETESDQVETHVQIDSKKISSPSPPSLPNSQPICIEDPNISPFRFEVPWSSEPENPTNNWIKYSAPFEINISGATGDVWPVTQFSVDDLAFIMKPNESIVLSTNLDSGAVTFTLPAGAQAIADTSSAGQSGWLSPGGDVKHEKVYRQVGRPSWSVRVPRNIPEGRVVLNDLKANGFPVVPHTALSKQKLRELGLLDAAGVLRFKMATIVHGSGSLAIEFGFRCKP